jgi:hypothetical protein
VSFSSPRGIHCLRRVRRGVAAGFGLSILPREKVCRYRCLALGEAVGNISYSAPTPSTPGLLRRGGRFPFFWPPLSSFSH